jgi:uncharacterized membrane protein YphA (DoxX/SURF4 family)
LTAGLSIAIQGILETHGSAHPTVLLFAGAAVVSGILLLIGLWTPVVAILGTFLELWLVFSQTGLQGAPIVLVGVTAGLAMLGPGAWSIDSYLFGRKCIEFPDR